MQDHTGCSKRKGGLLMTAEGLRPTYSFKRMFDILVGVVALLFVVPALPYAWLRRSSSRPLLKRVILLGAGAQPYRSFTSACDPVRRALRLWDVLCGRASVVGPRILPLADMDGEAIEIRGRVAPGLICLHWLRWRSNVAFCAESVSDREYAAIVGFRTDISILLRAMLVLIYGRSGKSSSPSIEILGVHIDNLTLPEALRSMESALDNETGFHRIAFVNADCLNRATKDEAYRAALNTMSLVFADGIGIKIAGTWLSRPIRQNVNGTDLFPHLCERLHARSSRLYLLGARKEVVTALSHRLSMQYPGIVLCGAQDGYFVDEMAVVQQIAGATPDVLLVALGAQSQETFISRNSGKIGAKLCIGVGGLFDFYSGRIPRAPQWMREAGLEWVYRLYQEPGRMWRRYLLGNAAFLARVFAERCSVSRSHPATEVTR